MPSGIYRRDRHKDRPRSRSGLRGVIFNPTTVNSRGERVPLPRPWKAYVRQHGQYVTLGYFGTKLEAAIGYNKAILRFFGPEAYFNPLA